MNKQDVILGLKNLGLKTGDVVLLHSSYISLGNFDGTPQDVLDAFFEVVGSTGTIAVPAFGNLGVLTVLLRQHPDVVISACPSGAVAAVGKDAATLCANHYKAETAHGEGTPYDTLAKLNGYVCLLGADQDRNTSLHGLEARLELPYLGQTREYEITTPDGSIVKKSFKYFPGPHRDFIGLDSRYRAAGVQKQIRIGDAEVRLIAAKDLIELGLKWGKEDPAFVLCDNPSCADCVRQRAAINASAIKKESFKFAVSSALAGRYIPEMIENVKRIGIDTIELDYIQGKSVLSYPADKLAAFAAELASENISISGVRSYVAPVNSEVLLEKLAALNVTRIVLPSVTDKEILSSLKANNITIILTFSNLPAASVAKSFSESNGDGVCFNPAEFVRCDEKPFLVSYRVGRFIKSVEQLDINDAIWTGESTRLAKGNSEIKELISIFRCRNFSGYMVLGGGIKYPGSLEEAYNDFKHLLANM
jgi:aminoglycoside 3-N-acetyltransferase